VGEIILDLFVDMGSGLLGVSAPWVFLALKCRGINRQCTVLAARPVNLYRGILCMSLRGLGGDVKWGLWFAGFRL
jgi:hypothetical protein